MPISSRCDLTRRDFLALSAAALLVTQTRPVNAAAGARPPNIIVILVDDLGYADLGCQGSKEVLTPNIDSIAANGVRFTDGYVSAPVCSPTRAGLLTGRYQQRFGHEMNPPLGSYDPRIGLPLTERTLADMLKANGYATGMVGKWHLGMAPQYHPMKRGFDEFYGFLSGVHPYYRKPDHYDPVCRGTESVEQDRPHTTLAFTREALRFIQAHRQHPFFLYLPYNAVHFPIAVPPGKRDRFAHIPPGKRRTMATALWMVDEGVGAILQRLRKLKLEQDTLIFFLSDNGGYPNNTSINTPLRSYKGKVYEGGIRVPFLAQWKGHIPASLVYHRPVSSLDIAATCLTAAGIALPADRPLDGADIVPYLAGRKTGDPHDALYWRHDRLAAVRKGDWKLVRHAGSPPELYNLENDISEKNDLSAQNPQKLAELTAALTGWESQMMRPRWTAVGPTDGSSTQPTTQPAEED